MLGYLHMSLQSMVIRYNGTDVWKQVLKHAGFEPNTEWDIKKNYDDQDTFRVFRSLGTILGLSAEEVWENFGTWLFIYAMETGWDKLLTCLASDLHGFLDNLSSMHFFIDQIAFKTEIRGPSFKCESKPDGSLRLHYYSVRKGLFPLVKGKFEGHND